MILEKQDSGVCLSTTEPNSPTTTTTTMATADSAQEATRTQCQPLSMATSDSPAESRDFGNNNHQPTNTNGDCQQQTLSEEAPPPSDTPDQSSPRTSETPIINSHRPMESTSNVAHGTAADHHPSNSKSAAAAAAAAAAGRTPLSNGHVAHTPLATVGAKSKTSSRTTPTSATPRLTGNSTQQTLTPTKTMGQRLAGAIGRLTGKSTKHSTPSASSSSAAAAVTTTISPQDQKILAIMRERKAAEMKAREQRDKKHSEWEQDNRRLSMRLPSSARGATAANNNNNVGQTTGNSNNVRGGRMSLGGRDFVRPQLSVTSNNSSVFEPDDTRSPTVPTASGSTPERVATPDGSVANSRRTSISSSVSSLADGRWYDPQRMRVLQAQEKKRSVEQRLEQQRREMEEHAKQLKAKQEQDLQRASSLRLTRDQQQAMRARMANDKVQQKREMMTKQKQQSLTDLSARQEAIDAKLAAAELKAQKQKEEELQRTKSDLHKRLEQSRQRQKQMEEELETWRQELIRFNQWQGDNAEKVAQQNKVMKGVNACKLRLEKEKKQQDNMKKLMTADEKRLAEIEATIETKGSRTSVLLKEKEEVVMRSRERAMATKQLRDELRAHYSMNDIDQLNKQVALENRLMSRIPGSSQTSLNASMTSLA